MPILSELPAIDLAALAAVTGGAGAGTANPEPVPAAPTAGQQAEGYGSACARGAATGALIGGGTAAITGAGILPAAGVGAGAGCVRGMAIHSMAPTPAY